MASGFLKKKNNENFYPNPNWPVGSIYTTVNNVNPSKWFGGMWELFAPGKCLVGVDHTQTEFNTVKKTGGEKTHKLNSSEIPNHNHEFSIEQAPDAWRYPTVDAGNSLTWGASFSQDNSYKVAPADNQRVSGTTDQPHNNLQPYITVYFYIRIA